MKREKKIGKKRKRKEKENRKILNVSAKQQQTNDKRV